MIAILIAYISLFIIFFIKYKRKLLIVIPVLNVIADSFIYFFDESNFLLHIGNVRAILILLYIVYFFAVSKVKYIFLDKIIISFLALAGLLSVFNSSNTLVSVSYFIKLFIIFVLFIVAHNINFDKKTFIKFLNYIYISIVVSLINLLVSQFYELGNQSYKVSIYEGLGGTPTIYIGFALLVLPLIIKISNSRIIRNNYFSLFIFALGSIFVIISMRRLSILSFFVGLTVLFYFYKKKTKVFQYAFIVILMAVLTFPLYSGKLVDTYNYRFNKQDRTLEDEGRYVETFIVLSEFNNGNIINKLFGNETFNSSQFFGKMYITHYQEGRRLHTFYSILIHGTGIVGFLLFFMFVIALLIHFNKLQQYGSDFLVMLKSTALGLFLAYLIQITSFGFNNITVNSLVLIFIGVIFGLFKNLILKT